MAKGMRWCALYRYNIIISVDDDLFAFFSFFLSFFPSSVPVPFHRHLLHARFVYDTIVRIGVYSIKRHLVVYYCLYAAIICHCQYVQIPVQRRLAYMISKLWIFIIFFSFVFFFFCRGFWSFISKPVKRIRTFHGTTRFIPNVFDSACRTPLECYNIIIEFAVDRVSKIAKSCS